MSNQQCSPLLKLQMFSFSASQQGHTQRKISLRKCHFWLSQQAGVINPDLLNVFLLEVAFFGSCASRPAWGHRCTEVRWEEG